MKRRSERRASVALAAMGFVLVLGVPGVPLASAEPLVCEPQKGGGGKICTDGESTYTIHEFCGANGCDEAQPEIAPDG
jgi:hypothetical protein